MMEKTELDHRYILGGNLPGVRSTTTEIYTAFDRESIRNDHLVIVKMMKNRSLGSDDPEEYRKLNQKAKSEFTKRSKEVMEKWGCTPALMEVIDCGEVELENEKAPYAVCNYARGERLDNYLHKNFKDTSTPPDWWPARACDILQQLAEAIDTANRLKVVNKYKGAPHGDINLTNILIENKKVVLVDFAEDISRANCDYAPTQQRSYGLHASTDQNTNELAPWRWDIFAFGILAHHILTLKRPFRINHFNHANAYNPWLTDVMRNKEMPLKTRVDCLLQDLHNDQLVHNLMEEIEGDIRELQKLKMVTNTHCITEAIKDALDMTADSAHSVMEKIEKGISTFPPRLTGSLDETT